MVNIEIKVVIIFWYCVDDVAVKPTNTLTYLACPRFALRLRAETEIRYEF